MGKEMKVPLNEVLHGKLTFFDMAKNLQTICSAVGQQKKLLLLHNLCLKMNTETFLDGWLFVQSKNMVRKKGILTT